MLHIPKSFTCKACKSLLSHPIDACPICGDQFYWLVIPKGELTQDQKDEFVVKMEHLVEGKASREFLTHGGYLWLPHRFWDFNAEGDTLAAFDWAVKLELFQHETSEGDHKERLAPPKKEPSAWDTLPKAPLPHFAQVRRQLEDTEENEAAAPPPPADEPVAPAMLIPAPMFAPLMALLFFIFLSLSYLMLLYHKNNRPAAVQTPSTEVANEAALLP